MQQHQPDLFLIAQTPQTTDPMNTYLHWFGVALFLLIGLATTSCSSDEGQSKTTDGNEVTFEFSANELLESRAVTTQEDGRCSTTRSTLLMAEISFITPSGQMTRSGAVALSGTSLKSAPIFMNSGTYTIDNVTLFDGLTREVIYAGVRAGAPYAQFLPPHPEPGNSYLMGEETFTVTNYTKPTISTYLLCTNGEQASNFGMPKFQVNSVDVTCFEIFFNLCNPALNNEHFVGEGTIAIYDKAGVDRTELMSDSFGEGDIATLCFADNLTLPDNEESYYIEVIFTNSFLPLGERTHGRWVSVMELNDFKNPTGGWDEAMNCVHRIYCPTLESE